MPEHHGPPGPYETEGQAQAAVAHILASPPESHTDGNFRLLEDTCRRFGVELGAFDQGVLLWLAGYEPATVAVVAGLFERFREGPSLSPLEQLAGPAGMAQPSSGGWVSGPMGGAS